MILIWFWTLVERYLSYQQEGHHRASVHGIDWVGAAAYFSVVAVECLSVVHLPAWQAVVEYLSVVHLPVLRAVVEYSSACLQQKTVELVLQHQKLSFRLEAGLLMESAIGHQD